MAFYGRRDRKPHVNNPFELFKDLEFPCAGTVKCGGRCKNSVTQPNRVIAYDLLYSLEEFLLRRKYRSAYAALEKLAPRCLCLRWHKYQAQSLVDRWWDTIMDKLYAHAASCQAGRVSSRITREGVIDDDDDEIYEGLDEELYGDSDDEHGQESEDDDGNDRYYQDNEYTSDERPYRLLDTETTEYNSPVPTLAPSPSSSVASVVAPDTPLLLPEAASQPIEELRLTTTTPITPSAIEAHKVNDTETEVDINESEVLEENQIIVLPSFVNSIDQSPVSQVDADTVMQTATNITSSQAEPVKHYGKKSKGIAEELFECVCSIARSLEVPLERFFLVAAIIYRIISIAVFGRL